ncbi:MAG: ankyrin repeat domain-containing protein [Alphaproteobacteria bacterium]
MNGKIDIKSVLLLTLLLGQMSIAVGWAAEEASPDPVTPLAHQLDSLLGEHKFDQLEEMSIDFRKTEDYFSGGQPKLEVFYEVLCAGKQSALSFTEREKDLRAWLAAYPQSLSAHVALAGALIAHAQEILPLQNGQTASGERNPPTVKWALYKLWLSKGQDILKGLNPKDDPYIYSEYTELALAEDAPREKIDDIYAAAARYYPGYYPLYARHAILLQETWFGQPGELKDYLQSLPQLLPAAPYADTGQLAYAFAATAVMPKGYMDERRPTGIEWATLKEAYKTLEKHFGFSDNDWGNVFRVADIYKDNELAAYAVQHLIKSGLAGNENSQFYVGRAYLAGLGAPKNVKGAEQWLLPPASHGNPYAQFALGELYSNEEPNDYVKARRWYLRASHQDNAAAKQWIAQHPGPSSPLAVAANNAPFNAPQGSHDNVASSGVTAAIQRLLQPASPPSAPATNPTTASTPQATHDSVTSSSGTAAALQPAPQPSAPVTNPASTKAHKEARNIAESLSVDAAAAQCSEGLQNATEDNKAATQAACAIVIDSYTEQKQYVKVDEIYRQEIDQDPADAQAKINYSIFLRMYPQRYDEAIKYARAALGVDVTDSARNALAMALYDKFADITMNHADQAAAARKYYDEASGFYAHPETLMATMGSHAEEITFVKWLVSKKVSVNTPDAAGDTALLNAAGAGRADAVKMLLSMAADPNYKAPSGWSPLLGAAYRGHADVAQQLLINGADPHQTIQGRDAATLAESQGYNDLATVLRNYSASKH